MEQIKSDRNTNEIVHIQDKQKTTNNEYEEERRKKGTSSGNHQQKMAPPFVGALLAVAMAVSTQKTTNKHEAKFERMIDTLSLPPATVEFIDSPKQRVLFRGVAAGVQEPLIMNAFGIVYKDLAPVRVAGDIIFSQLSSVATDATERASGIATIPRDDGGEGEEAGMDNMNATTLAASRQFFDLLDGDNSGGLDRTELLASPELLSLIYDEDGDADVDADAAVDQFMTLADENGDGVISFVEFAYAAANQPRLQLVDDALAALQSSSSLSGKDGGTPKKRGKFGRKSPEDRFEAMLQECLVWEQDLGCAPIPNDEGECSIDVTMEQDEDGDNRLLQVLKGSLVGVHCEPVVDALKMCYLDYSPLRLGGDVIFKLLKQVVASQVPRNK